MASPVLLHGRMQNPVRRPATAAIGTIVLLALAVIRVAGAQDQGAANEFNDSHFHLTNYIQEGIDPRRFLQIMGKRVGRSTLFGIPLQQQWSYANSGRLCADATTSRATRRSTTTRSPTRSSRWRTARSTPMIRHASIR